MNTIVCKNLSRRYGDIDALKPLDLSVPAGSVFGFLGRNGAGKTTTIRLFTGLARPTSGRAWVNGVETTAANSTARQAFGYLPQQPAFYEWMTARELLDYIGRIFGLPAGERKQRVEAMLELVGLTDAAKRRINGYSGGMRQRLGIAQALLHNPPVLFLDEPTSALDPAGRYAVLELIESLRGQVTVFLSSHILADVERVCDTIGIIRQGELLLVSGRDELLAQYATNTILLELDRAHLERLESLTGDLAGREWVAGVNQEDNQVRVAVTDPAAARQAIMPLVVQHEVVLTRYEWVRPSLEEIFLHLSA